MGAVHVQVKLTNAIDEELVRRGLLNPKCLKTHETTAFVDTEAVRTVLPRSFVQELNLTIRGRQTARYADGREDSVDVTGPVIIELNGRQTIEAALVTGDMVLISQMVLETLDLWVDCKNPTPDSQSGASKLSSFASLMEFFLPFVSCVETPPYGMVV